MTILQAYYVIAIPGIFFLIYVRDKAPHDEACSKDATWLRWTRHAAFSITALALCYSIIDEMSQGSMFLLVFSAEGLVAVNAIVLTRRRPKDKGSSPTTANVKTFDIAARARVRRP